ncbi:IgE-binding protein [Glarea lozoyensis ATCC 20868]|uniref:IgE-binding protein n=1 Tax=Glarea lozoyensis (strain ATCC 20868 / MF5171) TaxID=1116229 RepID=S3CSJ7_GLAL2|nr:IgE-binding protein [Glarea lozoyensis ATCC 20868]EPE29402.1 IgE-binding protein [Glarea lozoyensis ATCC 20868]
MYTKNILVAAFATLAAAAPTARSTADVLGLIATHSGDINVHLRSINENGLKFWIGKPTTTYCPSEVVTNCPNGTFTQLIASTDSEGISMNVEVPGGQQAYVANDGSLSVTQAHSGSTGTNGLRGPFSYTPAASEGTVGQLSFNGNGFLACPSAEASVYQIFAAGYPGFVAPEGCIGVGLATSVIDSAPVWQYI